MKWRSRLKQAATIVAVGAGVFQIEAAPGPIGVSSNGRYFVDARGEPFYFLADTQWELFRRYSLSDARQILEDRKAKGFSVVMVMLTGVGNGTGPNLAGEHPWLNDNPATPNPDYFAHVDEVIKLAEASDLQLLIGIYHQTYGKRMTVDNARAWAAWVTSRYRGSPNIMWTFYPKAEDSYKVIARKLAEGIQEGDRGRHLVSMHPDPSPASSSFMHAEPWLGFNSIQVWNRLDAIHPMTIADYQKAPAKPVAMLEGVYEGGEEYGYPITRLLVRREAYYTCLAGGFHGYGHNDSWRVRPSWRAALDDPGAKQMAILKSVLTRLPHWWTLVPDQSVLSAGGRTRGYELNLGARSSEGDWIVAYIAGDPNVTVNLAAIPAANSVSAEWVDPVTGNRQKIGQFPTSGPQPFSRPVGWQDAVLVMSAAGERESGPVTSKASAPQKPPALGPLRVHPANPRYFMDGNGKAVFLTGSHTWGNLQDYQYASLPSPPAMDFAAYLDFLQGYHHNFFRLWAWESAFNPGAKQGTIRYSPMPYQRPGPGIALDGNPKFDLDRFDESYFERLRTRVRAARDRGIYASVMLFNGFSIEGKGNVGGDPWRGHPFNPSNNINNVNGGGGKAIHALSNATVTARQEAYVRKVIDTLNDLDNVLYEISNEDTGSPADTAWQYQFIRFIHEYEATKPSRHPVGMTATWPGGGAVLLASPADWISPAAKLPLADGRKVILNDTDHSYFWTGLKADGLAAQRAWVWENFVRGSQCLFMDPYLDPSHDSGRNNPVGGQPDSYWETLRSAMGWSRRFAERIDLMAMSPHTNVASTGYCLANPGTEYLIYQPKAGEAFTVKLNRGTYRYEWFDPVKGIAATSGRIDLDGGTQQFNAPLNSDAILYLKRQ